MLAVILADGSVDFGLRYTTTFTEQPEVVERLVKEFSKVNGLKIKWTLDKLHNSLRARAYGKSVTDLIGSLVATTRTRKFETYPRSPSGRSGYPRIRLPREIFESKRIASEFLRYYSTCDAGPEFIVYRRSNGYIQLGTGIAVGCGNPHLRRQLKTLFPIFGIKTIDRKEGLEIKSADALKNFRKSIGFLEESKVRRGKLFRGFPKNDVVDLIILCRQVSRKYQWINPNFSQIGPLEKFLQETLRSIRDARRLRNLFRSIGVDLNSELNEPS
jgi:hypothetical protein